MKIQVLLSIFLVSLFSNSLFAEEGALIGEESATYAPIPVTSSVSAETEPFGPVLDRHSSPYVGANAIITGLRGYQWLDDNLFPSTANDTSGAMILARFGRLVVVDYALVFGTAMVAQHEVFGHGFRLREFGVKPISYKIRPLEGSATFNAAQYNQLSFSEKAAVATGGMEANTVLANQLRVRWVDSGVIDSREATLYFLSSLDQTGYVLDMTSQDNTFSNGHDVAEYIRDVNGWYQRPVVSMSKLKKRAWLDFFDPYLFYSVYSMGEYVTQGTQQWEYPMLSMGEYRYLPAARMVLAPYGAEYQLSSFIKGPYTIFANVRYGNTGSRQSSSVGVEVVNLFNSDLLKIGAKVDVWNQPKLFTPNASLSSTKLGGAASMIARYRMFGTDGILCLNSSSKSAGSFSLSQCVKGMNLGMK